MAENVRFCLSPPTNCLPDDASDFFSRDFQVAPLRRRISCPRFDQILCRYVSLRALASLNAQMLPIDPIKVNATERVVGCRFANQAPTTLSRE
jgi:hypothetical protein